MNGRTTKSAVTGQAEHAFTLVELLVVFGIIAALACLMLPTYARATRNTQATVCLNNLEQIGRAVAMYAEEHQNYFPQVIPWWSSGPYYNGNSVSNIGQAYSSTGTQCGGEWLCEANQGPNAGKCEPNTAAPMLMPYLSTDMNWVCPKRLRGTDMINAGTRVLSNSHPSLTGYLSYGFNDIGIFSAVLPDGLMSSTTPNPFKASRVSQTANTVSICEVSGLNDTTDPNGMSDAAWLDTVWAGNSWNSSGGNPVPTAADNIRISTAYAKHSSQVNVLYVDGHVAPSRASQLYYYQWYGYFGTTATTFPTSGVGVPSNSAIAPPVWDNVQWSSQPE